MTRLSPPTEFQTGSPRRTEAAVARARAALAWERAWPALWPASGIAGLFAAAALFGLPALLPWPLHALALASLVTGIGLSLYLAFEQVSWPSWRDGARRVERDSTLAHRPISEREDVLLAGSGDALAEALWQAHLRRRLADLGKLRFTWPRSDLPRKDPRALRYLVLLLIVAGAVVAGKDWSRRLVAAFGPGAGEAAGISIDAWIDPPAYTGQPPVYLSQGDARTLTVPTGSTLNLRVHGASHAPYVSVDGAAFTGGGGEYASTAKIADDTSVRVRAGGRTIGAWRLSVLPDHPPSVAFSADPARTENQALKLAFTAKDDYGVTQVRAVIAPHKGYGKKLVVDLPLDASSAKSVSQTSYRDLTAHPYAGLDVDIVLEAVDGAGQVARAAPRRFTLPERVFTDPLARALIELRQMLGKGDVRLRPRVAATLQALTIAPELFYQDKLGVYMGIRTAYWTLKRAHHDEDFQQVSDLLWQIATDIERGGLLSAAEELRRIKQLLAQALAQGAPQEVIDALLERYREALQKYLRALAENPPDAGQPVPPDAKSMSQQDLESLLKAIEQLAQSGAREQAAEMLAMLQNLLENLRMTQGSGGGGGQGQGQMSPQDKALSDAIQGLGELMGKQRGLVDKTFREQQGKGDPKDGGAKGLAEQQRQLHDQLGQLLKNLDKKDVPQNLGDAGKSMGQAENDLNGQDLPNAGVDQKNALDAMRKSAAEMSKTLMSRAGQKQGQQQGQGTDPLGRDESGGRGGMGGKVKVPGASDLQRAREILQELRKRAAERGRPQQELDYIDRLLKQF